MSLHFSDFTQLKHRIDMEWMLVQKLLQKVKSRQINKRSKIIQLMKKTSGFTTKLYKSHVRFSPEKHVKKFVKSPCHSKLQKF